MTHNYQSGNDMIPTRQRYQDSVQCRLSNRQVDSEAGVDKKRILFLAGDGEGYTHLEGQRLYL